LNKAWIEPERIVELNEAPERPGDYVLYWMQQSQRAQFNPALEMAVAQANRLALPVVVGFGLTDGYPEANARHYTFMLEGLAETAEAIDARGLRFVIRRGGPDDVAIALAQRAALVVCDRGYLRPQRAWRTRVAAEAGRRLVQVEGDVVVPVGAASAKHEIAARTLRPKLAKRRDEFLTPLAKERVRVVRIRSTCAATSTSATFPRWCARCASITAWLPSPVCAAVIGRRGGTCAGS